MTNKQYLLIAEIKRLLKTISTLSFVGEYPDDMHKSMQLYPNVLIQCGSSSNYEYPTARNVDYVLNINLILTQQIKPGKTRLETMLDTETAINDLLGKSLTINNTCRYAYITNIERGDITEATDVDSGYASQLAKWIITYEVGINDTRTT